MYKVFINIFTFAEGCLKNSHWKSRSIHLIERLKMDVGKVISSWPVDSVQFLVTMTYFGQISMTVHEEPDLTSLLRLTHPNTVQWAAKTTDEGVPQFGHRKSEMGCPHSWVLGRTASPYEFGEDTRRPVAFSKLAYFSSYEFHDICNINE